MDNGFIDILKQLVKEQGNSALTDAKKCKAFLADYTKNEYKKESRLLLQVVEAGVGKAVEGADDLTACKKARIRDLEDEYHISPASAADIVNAIALVLRGDKTVTVSQSAEKTAAENAAAEKAVAEKAAAERAAVEKAAAEKAAALKADIEKAAADKAAAEKAAAKAAADRDAAERAYAKAGADRAAAERAAEAAKRAAAKKANYANPASGGPSNANNLSSGYSISNNPFFSVVDSGSGQGSTITFGVIFAVIGLCVGLIIGQWIAAIFGGMSGWAVGKQVIGERVRVNLRAVIPGITCGVLIAFFAGWVGNGLFPDLAPIIARIIFIPFMIAGTALFFIARIRGNKILLIALIVFGVGGVVALTEPPFPLNLSKNKPAAEQEDEIIPGEPNQ